MPTRCNMLHLVGILFPYINDDARSKSHQICRLRVFENRVLIRIFRPNRDEVRGEWRKLHNEEFSDLYYTPNIFRVIRSRRMS